MELFALMVIAAFSIAIWWILYDIRDIMKNKE